MRLLRGPDQRGMAIEYQFDADGTPVLVTATVSAVNEFLELHGGRRPAGPAAIEHLKAVVTSWAARNVDRRDFRFPSGIASLHVPDRDLLGSVRSR